MPPSEIRQTLSTLLYSFAIWLVLLGLLGIATFALRKRSREIQVVLGFVQLPFGGMSILYGMWDVVSSLMMLSMAARAPLYYVLFFVGGFVQLGLGGVMVSSFVLHILRGAAESSGRAALRSALAVFCLVAGVVGVGVGVAMLGVGTG